MAHPNFALLIHLQSLVFGQLLDFFHCVPTKKLYTCRIRTQARHWWTHSSSTLCIGRVSLYSKVVANRESGADFNLRHGSLTFWRNPGPYHDKGNMGVACLISYTEVQDCAIFEASQITWGSHLDPGLSAHGGYLGRTYDQFTVLSNKPCLSSYL